MALKESAQNVKTDLENLLTSLKKNPQKLIDQLDSLISGLRGQLRSYKDRDTEYLFRSFVVDMSNLINGIYVLTATCIYLGIREELPKTELGQDGARRIIEALCTESAINRDRRLDIRKLDIHKISTPDGLPNTDFIKAIVKKAFPTKEKNKLDDISLKVEDVVYKVFRIVFENIYDQVIRKIFPGLVKLVEESAKKEKEWRRVREYTMSCVVDIDKMLDLIMENYIYKWWSPEYKGIAPERVDLSDKLNRFLNKLIEQDVKLCKEKL